MLFGPPLVVRLVPPLVLRRVVAIVASLSV
jgi:hypothetical protein